MRCAAQRCHHPYVVTLNASNTRPLAWIHHDPAGLRLLQDPAPANPTPTTEFGKACRNLDGAPRLPLPSHRIMHGSERSLTSGHFNTALGTPPRARHGGVTRQGQTNHLPAQDLAQPPPVADCPGKADRLSEVRPRHVGGGAGSKTAGGQLLPPGSGLAVPGRP
jgi:hypothetical protein